MSWMGSGKAKNAGKQEHQIISGIDVVKQFLDKMPDEIVLAFQIIYNIVPPQVQLGKQHTLEWAEKEIRRFVRSRFIARMGAKILSDDIDIDQCMNVVSYFVPAVPQKLEVEADVKNRNLNCDVDFEKIKTDEDRKAVYAAIFGEIPIIED